MIKVMLEYTEDENEVCVIPVTGIPTEIYSSIIDMIETQGYQYWLPADKRCGYRFVKEVR